MVTAYVVHDLLRIDPAVARHWNAPSWATAALRRAPWVVVRREREATGIAVGVRGTLRSERFAAIAANEDVREVCRPRDLVARIGDRGRLETTFHETARTARLYGLRVYPAGSFAFQLASNVSSTHAESDLDLLVAGEGVSLATWQKLANECRAVADKTGVRIDVEVAFGDRGIALFELARGGTLIAKSALGPQLIACPS